MSRRSSPVFYPRRKPQSEGRVFDYAGWSAEAVDAVRQKVVSVVAEIEADKRARNVVPPYATMQELHRRLTPQELQQCATLVEQGRLKQYENINGPMFSTRETEHR